MKRYLLVILVIWLFVGCGGKKRKPVMTDNQTVDGRVTVYHPKQKNELCVPFADVEAIVSGTTVAKTATDTCGNYSLRIPDAYKAGVVTVKLSSISSVVTASVSVVHQLTDSPYIEYSSEVVVGMTNIDFDLEERDKAAPFNILRQIVWGMLFVRDNANEQRFPFLKARWELGEDNKGFTYFSRRGTDYTISLTSTGDPDEFDDSVILHELGHYMMAVFSIDQSPGGEHIVDCYQNQILDPRLAYSEGWADAFGQIVLGDSVYKDSFEFDVEDVCSAHFGPRSELVVASVFWDLYDGPANGVRSRDNDYLSIPFIKIWAALKKISGWNITLWDYYISVRRLDYVSAIDWDVNFMKVGADEPLLREVNWEALVPIASEPVVYRNH